MTVLVGIESYVLPVKNFSWRWEESLQFTNALGELEMLLSFFLCFSSLNLKYAPLSLCLKQNLLKILFLPFLPPPLQTIRLESRLLILDSGLENSNHSFSQLTEFVCFQGICRVHLLAFTYLFCVSAFYFNVFISFRCKKECNHQTFIHCVSFLNTFYLNTLFFLLSTFLSGSRRLGLW